MIDLIKMLCMFVMLFFVVKTCNDRVNDYIRLELVRDIIYEKPNLDIKALDEEVNNYITIIKKR
jgi:hypothetical protein